MKKDNRQINQWRVKVGPLATPDSYGNTGAFAIPYYGRILFVVASDGMGWDHVSVSFGRNAKRCPTWEEMAYVKSLFFRGDETVVQFHPRSDMHVNFHEFCLHLWRNQKEEYELPPMWMVGPKEGGQVEDETRG